ncbi:MAG: hypothetical protein KC593_18605 [Myxococcales bacterium]|nr:hypothetical protein [Myxococcales bacterium]
MAEGTRYFFFGDSLTLGVGDEQALGWVGRVMRSVRDDAASTLPATFYNLGVRGDTGAGIARRWRGELEARCPLGVTPRMVFAFGVNDARTLYPGGPSLRTVEDTLEHAQAILEQARELGPVIMVGPPAVADEASDTLIEERSSHLRALCRARATSFVETHAPTRADARYLPALRAGDGYHPGAVGYELLAEVIGGSDAWRAWHTASLR